MGNVLIGHQKELVESPISAVLRGAFRTKLGWIWQKLVSSTYSSKIEVPGKIQTPDIKGLCIWPGLGEFPVT
jgi:hypothetical protein